MPIGVRWVDSNKGDSSSAVSLYRSRLVVQETKNVSTIVVEDASQVFSDTGKVSQPALQSCARTATATY